MYEIQNFTINGDCSNCGQCCGDVLPLSPEDLQRLRKYVKQHNIKPINKKFPLADTPIDLSCPFRDDVLQVCTVYPARPWICRAFRCDQDKTEIQRRKAAIGHTAVSLSLRYALFGDEQNRSIQDLALKFLGGTLK